MAYIKKRFHLYTTLKDFEEHKENDLINPDSLVFIKETLQIYTQDTFFGLSKLEFDALIAKVEELENTISGNEESDNLDSFQKIVEFLKDYKSSDTLKGLLDTLEKSIGKNKQLIDAINRELMEVNESIDKHIEDEYNPHKVTKSQVGLSRVDNTSDLQKPISNATQAALNKKVDKVEGKQLSTNDLTNELKQKLDSLQNYNDAELRDKLETLTNNFNTLVNANPTQAIENFNEIIAFLENIEDDETLSGIIAGIETQIGSINSAIDNINTTLEDKVDKVDGKGLSTNDFTDEYKDKLLSASSSEELTIDEYNALWNADNIDNNKIYIVSNNDNTDDRDIYVGKEFINYKYIKYHRCDYAWIKTLDDLTSNNISPVYDDYRYGNEELLNIKDITREDSSLHIINFSIYTKSNSTLTKANSLLGKTFIVYHGMVLNNDNTVYTCKHLINNDNRNYDLNIQLEVRFSSNVNHTVMIAFNFVAKPDWNETNEYSETYIKNKPTKLSQFENDSNFVTNSEVSEIVGESNKYKDLVIEVNNFSDIDGEEALQNTITEYFRNNINSLNILEHNTFPYSRLVLVQNANDDDDENFICPFDISATFYIGDNKFTLFLICRNIFRNTPIYWSIDIFIECPIINNNIDINNGIISAEANYDTYVEADTTCQINLNSDLLDDYHANVFPDANTIPVADENAMLNTKGIKFSIPNIYLRSIGWYRVYYSGNNNNTYGDSIILNINRANKSTNNEAYQFAISVGSNNKVNITQLSGFYNSCVIPKIRVLSKNNSIFYIDIYYNDTVANSLYVYGLGRGTFQAPVISNDIPPGYTSTEFNTGNGLRNSSDGLNADKLTTKLLTNENLNNCVTTGIIYSADSINKCVNKAASGGFTLQSFSPENQKFYQLYISNDGIIYKRFYSNSAWTDWRRLITETDILTGATYYSYGPWTAIPTNKKIISGNFNTDVTINLNGNIPVGENITIFMHNNATSAKTINFSNFSIRNVDTISVDASKAAEINIANDGTYKWLKAVNYED